MSHLPGPKGPGIVVEGKIGAPKVREPIQGLTGSILLIHPFDGPENFNLFLNINPKHTFHQKELGIY